MGKSLLVQQQWHEVKRARNQTTSGLEFDRGDVRRRQISTITRQELLYKEVAKTLQATWYILYFPPNVSQSLHSLGRPRQLKSRPEREKTVISLNTFSVKYRSNQKYTTTGWKTTIDRERRLLRRQHSWATSREGRLSDYEILQEPRKITTGKHQLE